MMRQTQLEFYIQAYELEHEQLKKAALRLEELMSIIKMLFKELEEKKQMNREDIIRMAREAKFATEERGDGLHHVFVFNFQGSETEITEELERFAALVASAEREACEALHDHEDVQAPVGNSSWGEAYQEGWGQGTAAYLEAIKARGQA